MCLLRHGLSRISQHALNSEILRAQTRRRPLPSRAHARHLGRAAAGAQDRHRGARREGPRARARHAHPRGRAPPADEHRVAAARGRADDGVGPRRERVRAPAHARRGERGAAPSLSLEVLRALLAHAPQDAQVRAAEHVLRQVRESQPDAAVSRRQRAAAEQRLRTLLDAGAPSMAVLQEDMALGSSVLNQARAPRARARAPRARCAARARALARRSRGDDDAPRPPPPARARAPSGAHRGPRRAAPHAPARGRAHRRAGPRRPLPAHSDQERAAREADDGRDPRGDGRQAPPQLLGARISASPRARPGGRSSS